MAGSPYLLWLRFRKSDGYYDICSWVTCPQVEEAFKGISGSLEMQFSFAGVEHGCYNLYFILMNSPDEWRPDTQWCKSGANTA